MTTRLEALYEEEFRPLNAEFKQIATDWQMRRLPGGRYILNDHTDLDYDFDVLDRLSALNERLDSIKGRFLPYSQSVETTSTSYRKPWKKLMVAITGSLRTQMWILIIMFGLRCTIIY